MTRTETWLAALAVTGATAGLVARAEATHGNPTVEPKADQLLHKMSDDLAALQSFQFDADNATELITTDGQKIQMLAEQRVSAVRPNKLRADRSGAFVDTTFYYDGKTIAVYGRRSNLYAIAQAPPNIDQAIDFARDRLSLDAPAADLLNSHAYQALMEDVVSGRYIALEPVGDRMCHHLAYRGEATDWQIWIEDGERALPCRFVITSKNMKGAPQYAVDLSHWTVNPSLPASTFVFTPPPDAAKIDFLAMMAKKPGGTHHDR